MGKLVLSVEADVGTGTPSPPYIKGKYVRVIKHC
jgi:hypothetical protein